MPSQTDSTGLIIHNSVINLEPIRLEYSPFADDLSSFINNFKQGWYGDQPYISIDGITAEEAIALFIAYMNTTDFLNFIRRYIRSDVFGLDAQETFEKYLKFDREFKVRAGKTMQYDLNTGKRDKAKFYWIKKDDSDKEMRQVFFGLHLLELFKKYKIGIVESEKTALMCDLFFDEKIIWLASGGLMGINERKLQDLSEREIILFPDLSANNSKINAYDEWKSKAEFYGNKLNIEIKINQFLMHFSSTSDRENQADLADFILKDLRKKIYK